MPPPFVYLDHAATAPVLPEALAAMQRGLELWANPSSPHRAGRTARAALEDARERIKAALGWSHELVFTSGASEALALALGRARCGPRIVSPVEHEAALRSAGEEALRLTVDGSGLVDPRALDDVLAGAGPRPVVAVQQVNSETGVIQPLAEITAVVRARGGVLLADCTQGAGKLPLPPADLIAIAAHKFGGPPGIGALLVRDFALVEASGGQERGYRPGTENLPAALAMAAALEAGSEWLDKAGELRAELERSLVAEGAEVVAGDAPRLATIGAYRLPGFSAAAQLIRFDAAGIAVSAGSACSSGSLRTSHVLTAMGWEQSAAGEVIRVSIGRDTTAEAIDRFLAVWREMARARVKAPA
jgi:cysteine desulfurase